MDNSSFALLPYDAPEDMLACRIIGDGNCLPCCGSLFLFGTENCSTEVRMRVAYELAEKEVYYTGSLLHPRQEDGQLSAVFRSVHSRRPTKLNRAVQVQLVQ